MISVLIETTLYSLTNMATQVDLPAFPRNIVERDLVPLLLLAVPRLAFLKDRSQPHAADPGIELPEHPKTLLEELQARILANSSCGSVNTFAAKSAQASVLYERQRFTPAVSDVKIDH